MKEIMKKIFLLFILLSTFTCAQLERNPFTKNQKDYIDAKLSYVTPEDYGAVGNGLTSDASAILAAFTQAILNSPEKAVVFRKVYSLSSPIEVDLDGADLRIIFNEGSKIVSDYEEVGAYNTLQGLITFSNGGGVIIDGMTIESYNTGLSYYDGLLIQDSEEIYLNNVTSKYAGQNGIRIVSADNLYVQDCKADSNLYAGLHVNNVKHATVIGGTYNYNGSTAYLNGYGITFSHQFFTSGMNEDIAIKGVQANYNLRKGLDVHGGTNVNISNNFVTGFTTAGIYAVGGAGGEANDRFEVRDIIISNNIIDVDSVWFATLDFSDYKTTYGSSIDRFGTDGILTGAYLPTTGVAPMEDRGSYKITGNIIKNFIGYDTDTLMTQYGIKSFVGRASTIELQNNAFYNSTVTKGILAVVAGNDATEANTVRITGNTVDSCYSEEDGIIVTAGQSIGITDNHFSNFTIDTSAARGGLISVIAFLYSNIEGVNVSNNFSNNTIGRYGVLVMSDTTYSMDVSITNNILKGTYTVRTISDLAFPMGIYVRDNIGASNFDTAGKGTIEKGEQSYSQLNRLMATTGSVDYAIQVDSDTLNFYPFTIENTFENGHFFADIEITAVRAATTASEYNVIAVYRFYARSSVNDTDTLFSTNEISTDTITGDSASITNMKPTLQWVGTEVIRDLQILFPLPFVTYNIAIKYTSYGLKGIYND